MRKFSRIKTISKSYYRRATAFIKRRPMPSFFIVLGLLLAVLIIGNLLQFKAEEKAPAPVTKTVRVYDTGDGTKATFQASIEKSGVIQVVAQAPGIVSSINVKEGDAVGQGTQLVALASNYQGGNAASVQRQIAQAQYDNVVDTFGIQKELIGNQRDVATSSAVISEQQSEQMKSPNEKLNTYTTLLRDLQHETTLEQLAVQDKGLDLSKEVSQLQLNLAAISESAMYPASPFVGKVERVYVHIGQVVSPGTPIATVTSAETTTTAVLQVPQRIAQMLLVGQTSTLMIGGKKVSLAPYYVSTQATDGQLYSVFYDIPEQYQKDLSDGDHISVIVPIDESTTVANDPLIPIDAVYQTQESAFVLVVENGKAVTRTVTLGNITGSYVDVLSGLKSSDKVIIDRSVIAGDKIKVASQQ